MSDVDVALHERVAVLETEIKHLRAEMKQRRDRDRYVIGTVVAIASVLVAVVIPFIISRGGT